MTNEVLEKGLSLQQTIFRLKELIDAVNRNRYKCTEYETESVSVSLEDQIKEMRIKDLESQIAALESEFAAL